MKKFLSIIALSTLLLNGCYAREMYLVDPVVSFQEQGVKTILFVGLNSPASIKVDPKFKTNLENSIYKEFEKFTAVKILRVDNADKLQGNYKSTDLYNLSQKYKSDLIVIGDIRNYIESKYVDQSAGGFSNTPGIIIEGDSNRVLNRFQINVIGNINLIKPDGKVLWTQRIEDIELTQYETTGFTNRTSNTEELAAYITTRDRLAEGITAKLVRNLLPYYTYK